MRNGGFYTTAKKILCVCRRSRKKSTENFSFDRCRSGVSQYNGHDFEKIDQKNRIGFYMKYLLSRNYFFKIRVLLYNLKSFQLQQKQKKNINARFYTVYLLVYLLKLSKLLIYRENNFIFTKYDVLIFIKFNYDKLNKIYMNYFFEDLLRKYPWIHLSINGWIDLRQIYK